MIDGYELRSCLRNIIIVLFLMLISFISWPFLLKGWVDAWPLWILYIAIMVFLESLLVSRKYFWIWFFTATFGITAACKIGQELFLSAPYSSAIYNIKEFIYDLLGNGLFDVVISFPLTLLAFITRRKNLLGLPLLLLLVLGILAGVEFSDAYYAIDLATQAAARNTAFFLGSIAVMVSAWATFIYNKTSDARKQLLFQIASVFSWILLGIIPGVIGLGWKYIVFAAVLPPISIHYFFEWIKGRRDIKPKGK